MNSSIAVLVAVCGMLLVLAGLFLLLILQVLHFGKRNALMSIVQFMGGRGEDAEEDAYTPLPEYKAPSPGDLRARAEALDFNATVEKYRQDQHQPPTISAQNASAQNATPQNTGTRNLNPPSAPGSQPFYPLSGAPSLKPGTALPQSPAAPLAPRPASAPSTPPNVPPSLFEPLNPGKLSNRLSSDQESERGKRRLRRDREDEDEDIMGGLIAGDDPEALF